MLNSYEIPLHFNSDFFFFVFGLGTGSSSAVIRIKWLIHLRIHFQKQAPALTVYQVRLLLMSVLPKPTLDVPAALN